MSTFRPPLGAESRKSYPPTKLPRLSHFAPRKVQKRSASRASELGRVSVLVLWHLKSIPVVSEKAVRFTAWAASLEQSSLRTYTSLSRYAGSYW